MTYQEWVDSLPDPKFETAYGAWNHQQARIDELEAKQQKAKENYHEICGLIDAHNKRCDEACSDSTCKAVDGCWEMRGEDGNCIGCPRRYRIED